MRLVCWKERVDCCWQLKKLQLNPNCNYLSLFVVWKIVEAVVGGGFGSIDAGIDEYDDDDDVERFVASDDTMKGMPKKRWWAVEVVFVGAKKEDYIDRLPRPKSLKRSARPAKDPANEEDEQRIGVLVLMMMMIIERLVASKGCKKRFVINNKLVRTNTCKRNILNFK